MGRRRRGEGHGGRPCNFPEGGKRGWREIEICTVVKGLLNVFALTSEEEMKAHVNKPFHPILASHSQALGQRKTVLKHWQVVQYKETSLDHLITRVPIGFILTGHH